MPNWVYNRVNVSTNDEEKLAEFRDYIAKEPLILSSTPVPEGREKTEYKGFSFHSFITPEPEFFNKYYEIEEKEKQHWYEWNCANWETKWDAASVDIVSSSTSIDLTFETAWAAPAPIWQAMTNKFPSLRFEIGWEEEQGFGEELTAQYGIVTLDRQWDIPGCHQDFVDQDKLDNCLCANYGDEDDWYDDCPKDNDNLQTYVIETVTKRYITAYSLFDAMEAAKADESGYDLPNNTVIKDIEYAADYRHVEEGESK
jgi:hypothetical protein